MCGYGTNPIFLNKKIKIGRRKHSLTPPTPNNISFLPYTPTPLKVDVICVSPLKSVRIRIFSGPYSVRIRENADQKNSEYWHFLSSEYQVINSTREAGLNQSTPPS